MTLQDKLQCLLAAADSLRQTAILPEAARPQSYNIAGQLDKINTNIVKLTEEIVKAEANKTDDIPF